MTGRGRFLLSRQKKMGADPPGKAGVRIPRRGPASNLPRLLLKKPPKQANCPLDRDRPTWYSVLEFEKRHRKGR